MLIIGYSKHFYLRFASIFSSLNLVGDLKETTSLSVRMLI